MAGEESGVKIEEFKKAAMTDPYTAMLVRMWVDAFVQGFEEARTAAAGEEVLEDKDYRDISALAQQRMASQAAKGEREMVAALATLGENLSPELRSMFEAHR